MLPGTVAGEQCCRAEVFLVVLVLAFFTAPTCAQPWTSGFIEPVGCVMHAVKMRSETVGVAVGDSGVIRWSAFYADDAGQRSLLWSSRRWHELVRFNDVTLLADSGYLAVGEAGTVVKAEHERSLPNVITVPTTSSLLCVDRRNTMIVVGGENGTMLRSIDNGATFTSVSVPTAASIVDVCVDGDGRWTAITPTQVLSSTNGSDWSIVFEDPTIVQRQIVTQRRLTPPDWLLYRIADNWMSHVSTDGGITWIDYFDPATGLRISDPNAQALSVSASADGLQHSIMYMRRDGSTVKIYHYVSFDAGLSWADQCTQFFTDFVGESQVMINDSTMISTSLTGQMLTFTRRGLGVQQWWRAPESVNIPFEPWLSHVTGDHSMVAGPHHAMTLSFAPRVNDWSFATSIDAIKDVCSANGQEFLLVDQRSYDQNFNQVSIAQIFARKAEEADTFALAYTHDVPFGGLTLRPSLDGSIMMIPYGKSIVWSSDQGVSFTSRAYADTSIWNTSIGTMVGGELVWVQVLRLSDPQAPFGIVSSDGGMSWTERSNVPFRALCAQAVGGVLIIATAERLGLTQVRVKIARSDDGGSTWQTVLDKVQSAGITNSVPMSVRNGRILCVAPGSLFYSDDRGLSWTELASPLLMQEDGLTTGHWTSDTSVVVYSKGGQYHTTVVKLPTTDVAEDENVPIDQLIRTADRVIMTDLLGSVVVDAQGHIAAAEMAGLARGVYLTKVEKDGASRTLKLLK